MPEIQIDEFERTVSSFIASFRWSIDSIYNRNDREQDNIDDRIQVLVLVEECRIRFRQYSRARGGIEFKDVTKIKATLLNFILKFQAVDDLLKSHFGNRRFRRIPSADRDSKEIQFFSEAITNSITVREISGLFATYLQELTVTNPSPQAILEFSDLKSIVPGQQIAPIQFKVESGLLSILRNPPEIEKIDRRNISSALESLLASGEELCTSLQDANCDPRLVKQFIDLHRALKSNDNIVQIGLQNIGAAAMAMQFQRELSEGQLGLLQSFAQRVSSYAAQFPEWARFSEQAAAVELDLDDVDRLNSIASDLITELQVNNAAEPEVPKTIEFVMNVLRSGNLGKRAAFAILRTVENLVSTICHYCVDFLKQTTEQTVHGAATLVSGAIIALLGIALTGAIGLAPLATKTGVPWLVQTAQVLETQINRLTK